MSCKRGRDEHRLRGEERKMCGNWAKSVPQPSQVQGNRRDPSTSTQKVAPMSGFLICTCVHVVRVVQVWSNYSGDSHTRSKGGLQGSTTATTAYFCQKRARIQQCLSCLSFTQFNPFQGTGYFDTSLQSSACQFRQAAQAPCRRGLKGKHLGI